jgi:hypothetical protein
VVFSRFVIFSRFWKIFTGGCGGRAKHILLFGGSRSGKTRVLVMAILYRALRFAGSRHLLSFSPPAFTLCICVALIWFLTYNPT